MGRVLEYTNLGVVEYDDGVLLQDEFRQAVAGGDLPDQLLLLEHPPVVTFGRNAEEENLVASPEELAGRGIEVHRTGRGGDVTFHGPGQLVGYPILDLNPDRRDVHRYVRDLEEVIIRTLADFGVASGRIPGLTGVWIGDLKICAIGVRISRWITSHGFALNVGTDLDFFRVIVPCGIEDRGVTSLGRVLGRELAPDDVRPMLVKRFAEVFEREPVERDRAGDTVQVLIWRRKPEPEILLLKRTPAKGDFWQPVTGKMKPRETPVDAAARETVEETGLRGRPESLDYVRDFRIDRRFWNRSDERPRILREHAFAMETVENGVTLSPGEHEEHQWTSFERAQEILRWDGNKRALERLRARIAAG